MWDVTTLNSIAFNNFDISTHTSRVGCDTCSSVSVMLFKNFYSHIPCGMWLFTAYFFGSLALISTHTSRVGCDYPCDRCIFQPFHFYSHIPCGMWRFFADKFNSSPVFLLTHPVWDVTLLRSSLSRTKNFYSHIPCGMWQLYIVYFNHIIPIYYRMDL